MVKHNNVVPNTHLRKHWQKRVKTFFDQAAGKKRRFQRRENKAAKQFPRPLEILRPAVHGQTIRYNRKLKTGRGFSLLELKEAGLSENFASSIGISVDHRRRNRSQESVDLNKKRLLAYVSKISLFPNVAGKPKKGLVNDSVELPKDPKQNTDAKIMPIQQMTKRCPAVKKSELGQMKKLKAFRTLRQEWSNQRNHGMRVKKASETKKQV